MTRIAISGAGAIAERAHIPAFKSIPEVEIAAIQSRTREKADRIAALLWPDGPRPRVYDSFDAMLEREHPDAVGIFTPNYLHRAYALKAIAAGAHVLVEKPIAPTTADARLMVDAASRAGRVLMVAMQRRYGGIEHAIKDAIDSGAIGAPQFIRARLSHGGPLGWAPGQNWFVSPAEAGGGAALDLGVHLAGLVRWLMGDIDSVVGRVDTLGKQIALEDTAVMILHFRSGAMGVLEASWSSQPPLSAIEIYSSEGRLMAGYPRLDISILHADGSAVAGFSREEILARFDPNDMLAPFRALAQNFVDAIAGRAKPDPDGIDGMRAVEVIEACYRSSRSGEQIKLPLT